MSLQDALQARKASLKSVTRDQQHIVDEFSSYFDRIECGLEQDAHQLYLGALGATKEPEPLKSANIKTIVSITEAEVRRHEGIAYHSYALPDTIEAQLLQHWPEICAKIDAGLAIGSVLVHCNMGVSRSGATVVAYVARRLGLPHQEALARVRACRSCVRPNEGFLDQLYTWAPPKP
jgi:hypothetical protein